MNEWRYTEKIFLSPALVREIAGLYFRKKLFFSIFRYGVLIIILLGASIHELFYSTGKRHDILAVIYVLLDFLVMAIAILEYRHILNRLQKAYGIKPKTEIEYKFNNIDIVTSIDQKHFALSWIEIKKVWNSINILMLVSTSGKIIALPVSELNPEEKKFIAEKLANLNLVSNRQLKIIKKH